MVELRAYRKGAQRQPGGLVFTAQGGGPLDPDNVGRAWRRALRDAKVRAVPFHSLRHGFATMLAQAGAHPRVMQALLGHTTARVSLEVYPHVADADLADAARRLGDQGSLPPTGEGAGASEGISWAPDASEGSGA